MRTPNQMLYCNFDLFGRLLVAGFDGGRRRLLCIRSTQRRFRSRLRLSRGPSRLRRWTINRHIVTRLRRRLTKPEFFHREQQRFDRVKIPPVGHNSSPERPVHMHTDAR